MAKKAPRQADAGTAQADFVPGDLPKEWDVVKFDDAILKGRPKVGKVKSSEYLPFGRFPIVDQGQRFIAGYCDDEKGLYEGTLPVIVFGDHTRIFKFVDFPFLAGADGTQILLPNNQQFDPRFFFFALTLLNIPSRGYNRHFSLLRQKLLPKPPINEQRAIAHVLCTVQRAKEVTEKVIAATRQLKASLMKHLFTYGPVPLNQADHVPPEETDVGPIPENWQVTCLEGIKAPQKGAIVSGPFGSNIGKRFFVPSGVPLIRGCNLTTGQALFVEEGFVFITEEKALELANCTALPDDLVFTAAGTIGQVGLIPQKCRYPKYVISNKQLRARVDKSKANPLFLFYWFTQPRMQAYVQARKSGTSIPVINLSVLRALPIGLPSMSEQRQIAKQLSAVDANLATKEQRREALDGLFKSLLHHLMTGKLRVKDLAVPRLEWEKS
jgi:type I restriction enzyme S subunit